MKKEKKKGNWWEIQNKNGINSVNKLNKCAAKVFNVFKRSSTEHCWNTEWWNKRIVYMFIRLVECGNKRKDEDE